MPSSALVELLHRVEAAIREYSEELVSQLARRDELEFEKEVKNTFITALMEVQNRQKEQRESSKRRRRDKALSLQGGTAPVNVGNTGSTGRTETKTGTMPVKVREKDSDYTTVYLQVCLCICNLFSSLQCKSVRGNITVPGSFPFLLSLTFSIMDQRSISL